MLKPVLKSVLLRLQGPTCLLAAALALAGCAGTTTQQYRSGHAGTSCQAGSTRAPAVVVWGTAWRSNQAEQASREATAERTIREFFEGGGCLAKADVVNQVQGRASTTLSDVELLRWARAQPAGYEQLVQLRLEELTPQTTVRPSLVLWDSGNLVQLRARVLDVATMKLVSDRAVQVYVGGGYSLRGASALAQDLQSALQQAMAPGQ